MARRLTFNPFTVGLDILDIPTPLERVVVLPANCLSTDVVGDCVKLTGDKVGELYQATKADIDTDGEKPAVGLIIAKPTPTALTCDIQIFGIIKGIYTSLDAGEPYLVGTDSQLTKTLAPPAGPGTVRYIQFMGVALSADEFIINPEMMRGKRVGD